MAIKILNLLALLALAIGSVGLPQALGNGHQFVLRDEKNSGGLCDWRGGAAIRRLKN